MIIDPKPFKYLEPEQYAGKGNGEIVFLDDTIPEDKKEWLKKEYKKWWNECQKDYYGMQ